MHCHLVYPLELVLCFPKIHFQNVRHRQIYYRFLVLMLSETLPQPSKDLGDIVCYIICILYNLLDERFLF